MGQVSAACNCLWGFCCTTPPVRGFVFFGNNAGRVGMRPVNAGSAPVAGSWSLQLLPLARWVFVVVSRLSALRN